MKNFYKKGAEAEIKETIFDSKKAIIKKRIQKNYRNPSLDLKIRKKRTKSEAKILTELYSVINVPKVLLLDENDATIIMEFIKGDLIKDVIKKDTKIIKLIGKEIKKIHSAGIIHGDLTTSNMLYSNNKIYFIDFGLGFYSKKIEDIATDLIVFKKTFNATHSNLKNGFDLVLEGYCPSKELLERMRAVEKRARYH